MAGAGDDEAITDEALARHRIGFARLSADGTVIERRGADMDWLPAPGHSCFEAPLLAGMEQALRDLGEGRETIIALPNVGFGGDTAKTTITIAWDAGARCFSLAGRADVSFEQRLVDSVGTDVWIWWRAAWLGADGGPAEYQAVGRDITRLKQLQREIELAHAEARSALVVRERLRIAHDLHDTIVQALVAVVAQLRAVSKVASRAPDRVLDELRRAEEAARTGLERGREALGQVRFHRAGAEGLEPALRRAATRLAERTGLNVACEIALGPRPIVGEAAEILYRIVEEALRNVESHAQATCVTLKAHLNGGEIEIVVLDDGRGFDHQMDYPGHYGLSGMHEQARMIGGRLSVRSEPARGSALTVRAPTMAGP